MTAWKEELAAITAARHEGRVEHLLGQLKALDARYPNTPEINYQLAWTCEEHDRLEEALPCYEKAVALGLPENELSGALLGLGSTLRRLGRYERAAEVFRSGQLQFPGNREFEVFLAMTLHNLGRHTEAMQGLLAVIAETADDPGITASARAIRFHAEHLDEVWPG